MLGFLRFENLHARLCSSEYVRGLQRFCKKVPAVSTRMKATRDVTDDCVVESRRDRVAVTPSGHLLNVALKAAENSTAPVYGQTLSIVPFVLENFAGELGWALYEKETFRTV